MTLPSTGRILAVAVVPLLVAFGCSGSGTGSPAVSSYDSCAVAFFPQGGGECVACLRSTCPAGLDALESACGGVLACVCPGGVYDAAAASEPACSQQLATSSCASAVGTEDQSICAACKVACGIASGSSSSGGSSSGTGSSSGSGSGSGSGASSSSGSGSGGIDGGDTGSSGCGCAASADDCLCYDPAPSDYTLSACPSYPCCWADTTYAPELDCECVADCSDPNPNPNAVSVAHCPP